MRDWPEVVMRLAADQQNPYVGCYATPVAAQITGIPVVELRAAYKSGELPHLSNPPRVLIADLLCFYLTRRLSSPRVRLLETEVAALQDKLTAALDVKYRGRLPRSVRTAVIARDGRRCRYCARNIRPREPVQLDHVIPYSRGGSHDVENLVVSCARCNSSKGAETPEERGMVLLPAPEPVDG